MEKALYSEMADLETRHWWFLGRRAIILDTLRRFASPALGPILDVGVGTGENAAAFARMGFSVEGIENALEAIAYAQKKVPAMPIRHAPFLGSAIEREKYGVVAMLDVIEHLDDDGEALRVAASALKVGGLVLVTVPAFAFLWTSHDERAHHRRRYQKKDVQRLLASAGLRPVFVSYFNFFLFPAIALVRFFTTMTGGEGGGSDFSRSSGFLNAPLGLLFGAERFLMRVGALPFGVSLIAVGKKIN